MVGDTWIESSVAVVTVRAVLPEMPPSAAVTMVEPLPTDVASPCEPAILLTVATAADGVLQVTESVRS